MANKKSKGIELEIGGNASGLSKALTSVNKQLGATQKELNQVDRLLKLDPKNTELLAQKQAFLSTSIETTEEKLNALKDAKTKADSDMQNGTEVNEKQYRQLQREIVETENSLKKLKDESERANSVLLKAANATKEFGERTDKAGKKLLPISAGIAAIGAASVKAFSELDAGYDTIITKTGATGESLEGLQSSMDAVFSELPTTAENAGIAIGEVNTRFGVTGKTLETLSKRFIEFAEINETDLNNSIGMTNKIMRAWNVDAAQTPNVLGLITVKAQETGISVDTLMNSVLENNSVFKEMGLSIEQSIGLMAEFEKNGVNSTTALAGLKKAVVNYAKSGLSMEQGLKMTIESIKNAKNETDALKEAQEVFGTKGAAEMTNAIREGRLSVEDLCKSMKEYGSTVEDTFNATLDPPDKAKVALNNLKIAGADLGNSILTMLVPILEGLVEKVKNFTQWFTGLDDKTKGMIITIAGIVTSIGPLLILVGKTAAGISALFNVMNAIKSVINLTAVAQWALNVAMSANPVGIVIMAIAALIAIFAILWNKCEGFRNFWISVWEWIKKAVCDAVEFVSNNWKEIIAIIINPLAGAIALLYKLNPKFKAWVDNLIKSIIRWFSGAKEIGANLIKGLWNGIANKIDWLKGKVKGVVDKIKGWFTNKDGFDEHSPSKWSEKVGKFLMQGLANGITADMSAEDALKKKIDNLKSFISDELGINESDVKLADAEYELWSLQNPNASETAKSDKQIGLLMSKITKQSEAVQIVNDALWESKQLTGDNSQESKAYQLQLVQERVALEKLNAEMQKAIAARQQLYRTADDNVGYSALKKVSKNAVSYMRNNNTARKAGQREGQTVNNVTQNYYGYKGTVSENNAALKKTLKNAEVALA